MDSEHYVLACYRYIELNPVRAGIVGMPGEYRWSSHGANGFGQPDPLISMHPVYLRIATEESERHPRYRQLVTQGIDNDELEAIRLYVQRQRIRYGARVNIRLNLMRGSF